MITQFLIGLNALANGAGRIMLAPIALMPGWVSATLVGSFTGILMLIAFKYTSNQDAIRRTRSAIKADLLALSLFQDSLRVSLRTQGHLLCGAGRLILHALVPIAVMALPMTLLLGQLALWYQVRPLHVGEETVVTVHLAGGSDDELPEIALRDTSALAVTIGPVRVPAKRMICWTIEPRQPELQIIEFELQGMQWTKQLTVGDGYLRTSIVRPSRNWSEVLLHPAEAPFPDDSPITSIEIDYPQRSSWTAGTNTWIIYWFIVAMVAALLARPLFKVYL